MTFRDVLSMSFSDLWRMKLRTILTTSGVVIGIAALVSMVSFGAGMQKNVAKSFRSFDLFTTLQVLNQPGVGGEYDHDRGSQRRSRARSDSTKSRSAGLRSNRSDSARPGSTEQHPARSGASAPDSTAPGSTKSDSTTYRKLDDAALAEISRIPGVKSVYPEETFPIQVRFGKRTINTTAQSLPASVRELSAFRDLIAGHFFQSDTTHEAVINRNLMKRLGVEKPDSIIGQEITLISARINVAAAMTGLMMGRSVNPFVEVPYRFRVCGVREMVHDIEGFTIRSIIIPIGVSREMEHLDFSNPFELLSQLSRPESGRYSSLTVRMKSSAAFEAARDSIEARGFRTFSFVDAFADIKKAFMIFDAVLAVVGFIALVVASLGIVNTMVMSIMERYREIGILKSLGADNRDISRLILVESSVIGFLGSTFGILLGWVITRIGSAIAKYYMVKEGAPKMDLFAMPLWLIGSAMAFGILVSLLAGIYPSRRAMRADPVAALRHE